jgi:hypothetical protein
VSGSEVLARFASLTIMSYGTSISFGEIPDTLDPAAQTSWCACAEVRGYTLRVGSRYS